MTSINIRKLSHSEMDLYRKPLLPETWSCFPVDKEIDTQSLKKVLQKDLDRIRSGAEKIVMHSYTATSRPTSGRSHHIGAPILAGQGNRAPICHRQRW